MGEEIRVEYVDFEEVEKWPRNPKDHDLHEIRKSFYRFGFVSPVLVDEKSGKLVAGHGRLDTLRLLKDKGNKPPARVQEIDGRWLIPVLRGVSFNNAAEAEAYLLADNRLSEIGGWRDDQLRDILSEMIDVDGLLEGTGFDVAEVMDILKEPSLDDDKKNKKEEKSKEIGEEYLVVISCKTEDEQAELLEELLGRGISCKALMG